MSLGKNRKHIFCKGLGNFYIRRVEPTEETAFSDAGWFKSASVRDLKEMQRVFNDRGKLVNTLPLSETFDMLTELLQKGKDELDLIRNSALQVHAVRLYGLTVEDVFQYYCIPKGKVDPNISNDYKPGEQTLPCKVDALDQDLTYSISLYYFFEGAAELTLDKCGLWLDPALSLNTETTKILDISGFERHGTLNSDYAAIWQQTTTPKEFLRFDGSNDFTDVGNVCDIATEDFAIEFWLRVPTDNAQEEQIISKKNSTGAGDAGWGVNADMSGSNNNIKVYLSDTTGATFNSANGSVVANTWTHVFISFDRDGNGTIYINGAVSGTPASIATEASTITNAISLYLARLGSAYGQVDVGAVRFHNHGVAGLPSTIATIALNHYNAEKASYGL